MPSSSSSAALYAVSRALIAFVLAVTPVTKLSAAVPCVLIHSCNSLSESSASVAPVSDIQASISSAAASHLSRSPALRWISSSTLSSPSPKTYVAVVWASRASCTPLTAASRASVSAATASSIAVFLFSTSVAIASSIAVLRASTSSSIAPWIASPRAVTSSARASCTPLIAASRASVSAATASSIAVLRASTSSSIASWIAVLRASTSSSIASWIAVLLFSTSAARASCSALSASSSSPTFVLKSSVDTLRSILFCNAVSRLSSLSLSEPSPLPIKASMVSKRASNALSASSRFLTSVSIVPSITALIALTLFNEGKYTITSVSWSSSFLIEVLTASSVSSFSAACLTAISPNSIKLVSFNLLLPCKWINFCLAILICRFKFIFFYNLL